MGTQATYVLAQGGFSTAIFGPAWPYEHFSTSNKAALPTCAAPRISESEESFEPMCTLPPRRAEPQNTFSEAEAVERSMWEGTCLPEQLLCNCKGDPHHRSGYADMPIMKTAREYPAGSSSFLETNFQQAFRPAFDIDSGLREEGQVDIHACNETSKSQDKCSWVSALGHQAPLPHLWQKQQDSGNAKLLGNLQFDGSPFLHIDLIAPTTSELLYNGHGHNDLPVSASICLFKLDLRTDIGLTAEIGFRSCSSNPPNLMVGFYTKTILQDSRTVEDAEYELSYDDNYQVQDMTFTLHKTESNARLVELGLYCKSEAGLKASRGVLNLYRLTIKPVVDVQKTYCIEDIRTYHRTSGSNTERRLAWTWKGSRDHWLAGLPWSDTTGPFSVFSVMADGEECGQAHCSEFPLRPDDIKKKGDDAVMFAIKGRLFGGGEVSSAPQAILPAN